MKTPRDRMLDEPALAAGGARAKGRALRVLVAVCDVVVRLGVARLLDSPGLEVRMAEPVLDARSVPNGPDPDVAFACADGCGMADVVEHLRRRKADLGVVLLAYEPRAIALESVLRVLGASRRGGLCQVLLDGVTSTESLTAAARRAAAGGVTLDGPLAMALLAGHERAHAPCSALTPREREALQWAARGYRNEAIADALVVSERAVEKALNTVYRKLGLVHDDRLNRRVVAARLWLEQIPTEPVVGSCSVPVRVRPASPDSGQAEVRS